MKTYAIATNVAYPPPSSYFVHSVQNCDRVQDNISPFSHLMRYRLFTDGCVSSYRPMFSQEYSNAHCVKITTGLLSISKDTSMMALSVQTCKSSIYKRGHLG